MTDFTDQPTTTTTTRPTPDRIASALGAVIVDHARRIDTANLPLFDLHKIASALGTTATALAGEAEQLAATPTAPVEAAEQQVKGTSEVASVGKTGSVEHNLVALTDDELATTMVALHGHASDMEQQAQNVRDFDGEDANHFDDQAAEARRLHDRLAGPNEVPRFVPAADVASLVAQFRASRAESLRAALSEVEGGNSSREALRLGEAKAYASCADALQHLIVARTWPPLKHGSKGV